MTRLITVVTLFALLLTAYAAPALAAPATQLVVSGIATPRSAEEVGSVTVEARDGGGNRDTGYRGTIHFTSSDPGATLPPDYTFTPADGGIHTFSSSIILRGIGSQSVTATDTVSGTVTGEQSVVDVIAGPAVFAGSYTTGANPNSVTSGDFNADSKPDLAVANAGSNTVSIFLGNGAGTFQAKVDYATGAHPRSVTSGDLNGDGKVDLAVANNNNSSISILLGNGDGTFQAAVDYATDSGPIFVTGGDFNADGKVDLAVANSNSSTVSILLGNGNGTFQSKVDYATGLNPFSITTGDFNADGKADLALVNAGSDTVSILLGNGNGTFQNKVDYTAGSGPSSVISSDFDGDGRLDLAVANYSSSNVSILLGIGNGTFHPKVDYASGIYPYSIISGDLNGDGSLDMALASSGSNTVSIHLGIGNGTFQAKVEYVVGNTPNSVTSGDFNADGRLDLAVANYAGNTVSILLRNGNGTFPTRVDYVTGSSPRSVASGDFNGDGKPDLAVANFSSTVSVILSNGNGSFQSKVDYTTGSSPRSVTSGDFNGDGRFDLAVANNTSDSVSILLANSNGSFQNKVDYATSSRPMSVNSGDFNGDGRLDLAVANNSVNTASILLGNGDGTFQGKVDYATGSGPFSVTVGDVNADGRLDLAVANNAGNSVSILLGNGNGTFQSRVDYATGTAPWSVTSGDFNADSKADLAVANNTGNTVSILLGNGDGTFQEKVDYATGTSPLSVTSRDFNGDTKPDLAVASSGSNTVSILLGNGNGTFQSKFDYASGSAPWSITSDDFNSDGKPDLAVVNATSETVSILLNITPLPWSATYPLKGTVTNNAVSLQAKSPQSGTAYVVALPAGSAAPNASRVRAGQSAAGTPLAANLHGSVMLTANSEATVALSALDSGTSYDLYLVAEDSTPALQSRPYAFNITTRQDGICGAANGVAVETAPAAALCSGGTPTTVAGSGPWTWQCVNTDSSADCGAPIITYPLTLTVTSGVGASGLVASSPAPDINCTTGICSQTYVIHTVVTLTATPDPDSIFAWSGACTGSGTCQVTMDAARTVTATFASKGLVNPAVAAGYYHSVALKNDGTLWAWGANSSGQLGDGTVTTRALPVQVGEETDWTSVVAGNYHTLAIKNNGTLWAWGQNGSGQLGDATTTNRYAPVQIGSNASWSSVAAGGTHTIALRSDGSLWAWGANGSGQLGNGTTNYSNAPLQVGIETDWATIAAGPDFTAAVKQDGTLWAWGDNTSGRLGDGTTANASNPIRIGTENSWQAVAANNFYNEANGATTGSLYALKTDGSLWRFTSSGAVRIGTDTGWEKLVSGKASVLAVKNNTLWTNGDSSFIAGSSWLTGVTGNRHNAAIKTDGTLWTWGGNDYSQLGIGTSTGAKGAPTKIGTETNWQKAVAGNNKTYALKQDGTLWGWGSLPAKIGSATNWADVVAEDYYAALNASGSVSSDSPYGNCNANNGEWLTVATKNRRLAGIKKNHSLWVCNDSYGGIATDVPKQIDWAWDWASVASGEDHTVAIKTNGTLWAWGSNLYGQLGDGTNFNRTTAVQIGSGSNWQSVAVGDYYTLALRQDGTLWAWGRNNVGQLAIGSVLDKNAPVQIGVAKDWQSISAGATHVMALKSDGSLWGWGGNGLNQLGDGSDQNRTSPVQVGVDKDWRSVSAGSTHTMAVKKDGTLWAWGSNAAGQHGDWATLRPGPPYNILQIGKIVPSYALTVHKAGAGEGQVIANNKLLSWDAGTGTASLAQNTVVTLTATPGNTVTFAGWSGACSGTEPTCTVTMNAVQDVTATFSLVLEPCSAPATISAPQSASFFAASSHLVSWDSSATPGATYVLTENGAVIYTGDATSFAVNDRPHGTYRYRVKAIKPGFADSSATGPSDTTIILVCAPVTGLTAPATSSDGTFTISWVPSTTPGASHNLYSNYDAGNNYSISANVDAVTSYNLVTAPENHGFTVHLAVTKQGYIPATQTIVIPIDYPDVASIASISAPAQSPGGSYTVSWSASATPGVTYNLYENCFSFDAKGECSSYGQKLYSGSSTSFTVNKSIPSQTGYYSYRVVAIKTGFTPALSGQATTRAGLYADAPGSIASPATVQNASGNFTVSWGPSPTPGVTYVLYLETFLSPLYTGSETSYIVTGARNGTYSFRVKATKANHVDSDFTGTATSTVTLTCGASPYLNVPATNTSGKVFITWGASDAYGATYLLEQSSNGGTSWTRVASTTGLGATVDVTVSGTYIYRVKATRADFVDSGYTAGSNSCGIALACEAPPVLTIPATNASGTILVTWETHNNIYGSTYVIEQSSNGGASWTQAYRGSAGAANVSVTASGTYVFRIKATRTNYTDSGYTAGSNSCSVALAAAAPLSLSVPAANTTGTILVAWDTSNNVYGATYVIEQSSNGGASWIQAYRGSAGAANISVTESGSYLFRIKATGANYSDSGYTAGSNSCSVALACAAPRSFSVPAANTTGTILVTWDTSNNVYGSTYVIEQSSNGGASWTQAYRGSAGAANINVAASGSYLFRIKATGANYSDSGYTAGSNSCSVALACAAPRSFSVPAANDSGTILVTWDTDNNVYGSTYVIEKSSNGGASWSQAYSGSAGAARINVIASGSYLFRIKATRANYSDSGYTAGSSSCTVSSPIDNVQNGGVVQLQATDITGDLTVSRPVAFTLKGGGGAGSLSLPGVTTLHGVVVIAAGTVTMENIAIAP